MVHRPEPGEVVHVVCAFCQGRGLYPFGHPPSKAKCGLRNGKRYVLIRAPYATCPSCRGTGRDPKMQLTCRSCAGKGVVAVREKR